MTATANFRQMAQHIGLAICGLMMRTAFGVFGILWGIIREIVPRTEQGRTEGFHGLPSQRGRADLLERDTETDNLKMTAI